jgi:pyridoxal 5'-phosphate synthase pdxT subunit
MKIGVLALQGAVVEHLQMLRGLGADAVEVRLPQDLRGLDGLILPGGESTAIGKLLAGYGLEDPLRAFARDHAVWGTCAGMILMAKDIGRDQPVLGLMDIVVERNAFGRQIDSFEQDLRVAGIAAGDQKPFPGIFIRAPRLVTARGAAEVIARLADGTAVAAREGRLLATSFHPELSRDPRFHAYFLKLTHGLT